MIRLNSCDETKMYHGVECLIVGCAPKRWSVASGQAREAQSNCSKKRSATGPSRRFARRETFEQYASDRARLAVNMVFGRAAKPAADFQKLTGASKRPPTAREYSRPGVRLDRVGRVESCLASVRHGRTDAPVIRHYPSVQLNPAEFVPGFACDDEQLRESRGIAVHIDPRGKPGLNHHCAINRSQCPKTYSWLMRSRSVGLFRSSLAGVSDPRTRYPRRLGSTNASLDRRRWASLEAQGRGGHTAAYPAVTRPHVGVRFAPSSACRVAQARQ